MRKALYLMGILNDSDLNWLAKNGSKSVMAPGSVLVQQGVPIEYLYILLDGRLVVQTRSGTHLATLMAGEVVGEISFVDSRPPLASVLVESASVVLAIKKPLLKQKLQSDGQFGARFYRAIALFLADRLRSTTGRLGYASADGKQDDVLEDPDELDTDFMQIISIANVRFDFLLKNVR